MHLHEYQAKDVLQKYGIATPPYAVATSIAEVDELIKNNQWDAVVVKAQIHAGGRGKAGGVKVVHSLANVHQAVDEVLGKTFVTAQTGSTGMTAHSIILSPVVPITREFYLSVTIDRDRACNVLVASPMGGMEIEHVAATDPSQILVIPIPSNGHLRSYHLVRLVKHMGWHGQLAQQGMHIAERLIQAFFACDAALIEINPLIQSEGTLLALDAKLDIDDNALFRQPALRLLFDKNQLSPQEALAQEHDLAYVALDGNIGCMVNGAGLAMATMDIIQICGGRPANFLDVGGSATQEKVAEGFKIILSDPQVVVILVNIFGGIMDCATLSAGIIAAGKEISLHVPLVVRLEGNNVEAGRALLRASGLDIQLANDLTGAAQTAVNIAHGRK